MPKIDGRTDVYSLGVVMSEMLSGRKPYRAATPIEMLREVLEREPRPLRQIDETLLPNSAWFIDNSDIPGPNRYDNGLHPVGQLTPNCFGSFDTPGNAFEWCEDEFTAYGQAIREVRGDDASGEIIDDYRRVLREGGFGYRACFCRSDARADLRAGDLDLTNGFRVVLSL